MRRMVAGALLVLFLASPSLGMAADEPQALGPVQVAVAPAAAGEPMILGPLSAVQLEERSGYNSDYLFGMSRGLANSTVSGWAKPILFLFTVPLDIAFLPFAAIGGLF